MENESSPVAITVQLKIAETNGDPQTGLGSDEIITRARPYPQVQIDKLRSEWRLLIHVLCAEQRNLL